MYNLADEGRVSHFDWRDPRHILATARHAPNGFFEAFLRLGTNVAADSIHFRQEAFELDTR